MKLNSTFLKLIYSLGETDKNLIGYIYMLKIKIFFLRYP
jgi:hypothetical protein